MHMATNRIIDRDRCGMVCHYRSRKAKNDGNHKMRSGFHTNDPAEALIKRLVDEQPNCG
jgi:hypothetical protein